MNRIRWALSCAYPATFAVIIVVCIGVLSIHLGQNNCHVRTEYPTSSTGAILYPEALLIAVDGFLSSPTTSLVLLRIASFDDIASNRNLIVFLTHPTFASLTALSIATLFKSPTLPGYRSRTSLTTVSTDTTPVTLTAAAMVGML